MRLAPLLRVACRAKDLGPDLDRDTGADVLPPRTSEATSEFSACDAARDEDADDRAAASTADRRIP